MISEKINISKLPYRDLFKVIDLITFDRTILSLFKNNKSEYFLLYLFDFHDEYDEYFFWKVELLDLYSFLYKRLTLRNLLLTDSKDFVFIIHSDYETIDDFNDLESFRRIYQILLEEIEIDCLPKTDSFWVYPVPNIIVSTLDKFAEENYLEVLRENSVYFIIEPKNSRFSTTVSTLDITSFLTEITKSYLEFVEFDFKSKFKGLYAEDEFYQESMTQLRSAMLPRVSDTKFGSFEVGLSVDFQYPLIQENKQLVEWQKTAFDSYKEEVLDINYDSIEAISKVIEKYPLSVRKAIFTPIYRIAKSERYIVKSTDRLKTFFNILPTINNETKKEILQSDDEDDVIPTIEYELQSAVFSVPIGGNIRDLDKKTLRKRLLAVSKSDTTEITRQETFTFKNYTFNAIAPLVLRLAVKGLFNILICDAFSIEVDSTENFELYKKLEEQIYQFYFTKVLNSPRSTEAQTFNIYFEVN